MFLGGVKRDQWHEMGLLLYIFLFQHYVIHIAVIQAAVKAIMYATVPKIWREVLPARYIYTNWFHIAMTMSSFMTFNIV